MLGIWMAMSLMARQPSEYELKATYLFNFAKFVEWPPSAFASESDPIVIGIVGDDPFGETLTHIVKEQTAQGRRIQIRHYQPNDDCSASHLLFVSRTATDQTADILRRIQGRPILTVGDAEDFARKGGIISFALVEKIVRFDINASVAERAGLKASSKLLAVARFVINS